MSNDSNTSREELAIEVANLRAQLADAEDTLVKLQEKMSQGEAVCKNEIEQMRQTRKTLGIANLIVENSPAVLFRREATEDATLVYVSENISQWGYDAAKFLDGSMVFQDIVLPEDHPRLEAEIVGYRDQDVEEYAQEYRIVTADGNVRWISDETSVIRDENGIKLFNQGVLMDITRRKKAEEALAGSEYKFRRTLETAGEGYLMLDKNLRMVEVNDAYCRMLGYEREEMLGKTTYDFATQEYRRFLEANKERFLKQEHRRFEGSLYHKDGHVVPVLVNANTLRDEDDEFIGHVAFVVDLTEQKKAVELAGEVQKSLLPGVAPRIPGLDIAGNSVASEIAGGDYFDYLEGLDPEHPSVSVAVGDISGHGVDAALLMTTARGFLRMRAAQPGSPGQIVTEMNRHLATDLDGSGRFMTLFYLTMDPENQKAHWVRAGHDPAMIYCPKLDFFTELSEGAGLPLGVLKESDYVEQANEMHPGQIIAIGTDGIWEARNREGEMFGKQRFKDVVRNTADLSAQEIMDAVFEAVRKYTGGSKPEDDITLVIVKYGFTDE
ncbi:SpoIIE family protein phosphatase [Pseudodesulfovibrio sp. zrk46]|uniref:PP2C family protein-serine/threonine phosphatase n=1 Tax=Pseudodesulfovibrio sp. zrk46 TaxID=2725288 RepID=UPI0014492BF6|nr:SpoIIE family protein phosphatase [Pseudodesulfovibrio sp. zrk46]QJB55801.1 SpoIIE family protein phosphatase [Pseudodesulfovibrio sp. zrk46]